ncbi:MAG TPA: ABC transporter permease subunit, partial [Reyranella sp.]|nr:ABC transporter permease subunit [Reyranella sp.]
MQRSIARREGSPFTGLGPVFMKEFSDHLSSARMMVLMLFVIAFGALTVAPSLTELRNVTEADPFLFLRIFTSASSRVPFSFTAALGFTIPLLAIGLGFDSVNGEFNRRT